MSRASEAKGSFRHWPRRDFGRWHRSPHGVSRCRCVVGKESGVVESFDKRRPVFGSRPGLDSGTAPLHLHPQQRLRLRSVFSRVLCGALLSSRSVVRRSLVFDFRGPAAGWNVGNDDGGSFPADTNFIARTGFASRFAARTWEFGQRAS